MKNNPILKTENVQKTNGFKNKLFKSVFGTVALLSIVIGSVYGFAQASSENSHQAYKPFSNQKALNPADKEAHYINDINNKFEKEAAEQKAAEAKHQQDLEDQAKIQQEKQAEEKAAEEKASAAAAASSQAAAVADSKASQNQSSTQPTTQAPSTASSTVTNAVADTSGFNFGSYHFPIAGFAGTGQVPANNFVYQWASDSRWFLIEQGGSAGHVIKANVGMGSAVTVNGRTYHVTDMVSGLSNSGAAYNYYATHINQHAIGFQTCDYVGVLTLWFAD